jgi:hypothetical protein
MNHHILILIAVTYSENMGVTFSTARDQCGGTVSCWNTIVTYSGFSIHDGTLLHSKSQYTTVKHSRQLSEHKYTSDPHGLGTLIPIEFFQQDLLWQSSNTHSHSCSQKASKHKSAIHRRAIGLLAHHNGTPAYSPSLTYHLPAPTIECLHRPPYKLTCSSRQSVALRITSNLYSFSDPAEYIRSIPNTTNLVTTEMPVHCCQRNNAACLHC